MSQLNTQDVYLSLIRKYIKGNVNTNIPAKIVSVAEYGDRTFVNVIPTVNDSFSDGSVAELPPILGVPVVINGGGGGQLSFPLAVGDDVLIVFSQRGLDNWKKGVPESSTTPQNRRSFSLMDAIAIPSLHLKPDPDHVVLKFAGSTVILYNNGNVLVSAAGDADVSAQGNIGLNALGNVNITAAGSVGISAPDVEITSSTLTHNGVNIGATHVHGGVMSGGSSTGVPV